MDQMRSNCIEVSLTLFAFVVYLFLASKYVVANLYTATKMPTPYHATKNYGKGTRRWYAAKLLSSVLCRSIWPLSQV